MWWCVETNCGAAIGMGSRSGVGDGLGAGPGVGGEKEVGWAGRRAGRPKGFLGWLGPWFARIAPKSGIGICRTRANGAGVSKAASAWIGRTGQSGMWLTVLLVARLPKKEPQLLVPLELGWQRASRGARRSIWDPRASIIRGGGGGGGGDGRWAVGRRRGAAGSSSSAAGRGPRSRSRRAAER